MVGNRGIRITAHLHQQHIHREDALGIPVPQLGPDELQAVFLLSSTVVSSSLIFQLLTADQLQEVEQRQCLR